MSDITKQTKLLVAELAVLVCLICIWIVRSATVNIDSVKACVLKQVVKADTNNIDVYRFLAGYYIKLGCYEEAVDAQKQVVRLDPNDARAHIVLADAYWECGHPEEALAAYKQAAKLYVDNAQVHFNLAEAYLKMDDKDSALKEYKILKTLDEQLADELLELIQK